MSLLTQWETSLPGSGNDVTSVLVNQTGVYAGSNGYVYLLDSSKGTVLATNTLSGMGGHEVRLAQPQDGSLLLVGTNGYVLGLNHTSLNTSWQTSLPKCGYDVVSVLCANGSVFAGCNGYVYRLDQGSGAVLSTNSLSGRGDNEVRLGISLDFSTLFVGINGYALGLNPTNLTTSWETSLPGCGYGITSIVGGVKAAYAGCNGQVYQLQESTGSVLHQNGLSGTGKEEVRMALDPTAAQLYVGTNGYGIGLRPDNLATVYSVSLPGSGYEVTDVVAGNEVALFATNGYVFQLDVAGNVDDKNSLVGRGNHETRLAITLHPATQLFVGINGYALGLSLPDYPKVSGPWMSNLAPVIGPMMLREVAIPGTHDSGTYDIGIFSDIGDDDLSWLKPVQALPEPAIVVKSIVANWAIAQAVNFSAQLASGIRYFDLRVQGAGGSLNFVHGLVGSPVTDLIDQLTEFFSQPTNNKEIILLDFNHFYTMPSALQEKLAEMLLTAFGNKLAPASLGANVTVDQLWASTYRIITFYAATDPTIFHTYPFLWPQQDISSPWPNKQDADSLYVALNSELPNTHSTFFVLQGILTPSFGVIAEGLVPFTQAPSSLASQANSVNKQLLSWLSGGWKNKGINIVICDWFSGAYHYVGAVVNLNHHAASANFVSQVSRIIEYSPTFTDSSCFYYRLRVTHPSLS